MGKIKILVAEDTKFVRNLYEMGLSDDTFEKKIVNDGGAALEEYVQWKPDIVVLDIVMPVMSGYEVLKKIREMEPIDPKTNKVQSEKTTVIIMATSLGAKEDIMDCLKQRIHGYVVKPIKPNEIAKRILGYYHKIYPVK